MRSFTSVGIEYFHRLVGYAGEAQYLHGHHGQLTIEVEGEICEKNGFVCPCNDVWDYIRSILHNFDHTLILQENDPLLPEVMKVYEQQGIRNGASSNKLSGLPIDTDLAKAYPEYSLLVMKKAATCENLIELFYSLLKDKLNIKKMTFSSGINGVSTTY